ncbi:nicotinate-nucleotide adenylyltransferase [Kiloniella antarctica]|uniref:Probable nicotinate-nucleotide adenylyltransferase n=1 Tax=Kiloniella antarctica TaxID=1550907 RepID=A0ABW5BPF5_9PROT
MPALETTGAVRCNNPDYITMKPQHIPSLEFDKIVTSRSLAKSLGGTLPSARQRVGLLGGSFNPAHAAHYQISTDALKKLNLDEVWWLVSPQNPLKDTKEMAPLSARVASALLLNKHPRIRITTIESQLESVYTSNTLSTLTARFPKVEFVWLMGADNLSQISLWRNWPEIFRSVKIAVFARPGYSLQAAASKAAQRFKHTRISENLSHNLCNVQGPAWILIHGHQSKLSSTKIRNGHKVGKNS